MLFLSDWTHEQNKNVNTHALRLLRADENTVDVGCRYTAAVLPQHYISERRLQRVFKSLDKEGVADLLQQKLPHSKSSRSGDLGEILATEYIGEKTNYVVPIKRLRWKDSREMPMRGEDVIGIKDPRDGTPLRFLKTEAKSRIVLNKRTIAEARQSLDRDNGLPSGHALSFVAERLLELGDTVLSDAITVAQLVKDIRHSHVEHLLFTFTGNEPESILTTDLNKYNGPIKQRAVGLQVLKHQKFIENVFKKAMNVHES